VYGAHRQQIKRLGGEVAKKALLHIQTTRGKVLLLLPHVEVSRVVLWQDGKRTQFSAAGAEVMVTMPSCG
jgi:hypothetical protein